MSPDSDKTASDKLGAIHTAMFRSPQRNLKLPLDT